MQVAGYPSDQFCERIGRTCLKLERLGILLLSAWTFEIDHQFARHRERDTRSEIFFNQRQGKIYPGCKTGRGVEVPILKMQRARIDLDLRKSGGKIACVAPVCGNCSTVQ